MILITGATGFIGSHLVKVLSKKGKKIRCFVRRTSNIRNIKKHNVEIIYGDLRDKNSLIKAMKEVDTVIHLGAVINASDEMFFEVNIKGTENLVKVAKESGIKRFIFISSVYVLIKNSMYGYSKKKGEEIVISNLDNWVILRSTMIYGKDNFFLTKIMKKILNKYVVPVIGNGNYINQPVYIDDVISIILKTLEKRDIKNKIYNIGGPETLTYNEMIEIASEELGINIKKIHVPLFLVYPLIKIFKKIFKTSKLPLEQILNIKKSKIVDIKEAVKDMNFSPIKFRKGIKLMKEEWD